MDLTKLAGQLIEIEAQLDGGFDKSDSDALLLAADILSNKALEQERTRMKGRWMKVTETEFGNGYQCSECGRFILTDSIDGKKLKDFPYCHCGAEMESEE